MFKKKIVGVLCALALAMGLVPATAFAAPIATDVVIHKMQVTSGTALAPHNGEAISDFTGTNLEGATPIAGIIFKHWRVASTATAAEMSAIRGLSTIAQIEAYATAHPTLLTGGTETAATAADGTVRTNNMAEGIYLFGEVNGATNNVAEYIGVPFLLELPAMRTDGSGYFGTGANALHVYPKNVRQTPGLDVETVNGAGTRIGSSSFNVYARNTSGVYELLPTNGTIALANGFTTLADLPAGEYRLVNTVAPAGYLVDSRPIHFTVSAGVVTFTTGSDHPMASFTPKATPTPVNDMITLQLSPEPVPEKSVEGNNSTTHQIGDEFTWTVTLPVPANISGYVAYTMSDTIDPQLSWGGTNGDVVVVSGATTLTAGTHYTQTITGQILTLTFDPAALTAYAGENLTVTYRTYINDTAVLGEDIHNNVGITFNNGHGGSGTTRPVNPPSVWAGGARFSKVDGANHATVLPGAEFKIATNAAGTTFLQWTQALINANTTGSFTTPVVGEDIVMVSNATGLFEIAGLAGGTYYLVETQAPTFGGHQYNLLRDPAAFTITKTSYEDANTILMENNFGLQIPQTGGIGTLIFTITGLSLMALAIVLLRKKKAAKEQLQTVSTHK